MHIRWLVPLALLWLPISALPVPSEFLLLILTIREYTSDMAMFLIFQPPTQIIWTHSPQIASNQTLLLPGTVASIIWRFAQAAKSNVNLRITGCSAWTQHIILPCVQSSAVVKLHGASCHVTCTLLFEFHFKYLRSKTILAERNAGMADAIK